MSKLALFLSVPILASCTATGWRAQRIDGSNLSSFERSVASLQNELPARHRDRFEAALSAIWIENATPEHGDPNADGLTTADDLRQLQRIADGVLTAVRRGDLLASSSESDPIAHGFLEKLDGLGYDEVLRLGRWPDNEIYLAELQRRNTAAWCDERVWEKPKSAFVSRRCSKVD